jgi:hypothetical protein
LTTMPLSSQKFQKIIAGERGPQVSNDAIR